MRRALLVLAGISAVAAAGLAAFSIPAALAALAVSWLCGLAWVVLWARTTSGRINQVLARTNRAAAELDRAAKRQIALRERVQGMAEKQREGRRAIARIERRADAAGGPPRRAGAGSSSRRRISSR